MSVRNSTASTVLHDGAKQDASSPTTMAGIDRSIWTDRMLAALDNGVKGRKWFSLIDKVYRSSTLVSAWLQVYRNQGAAGVDRQSVSRFASQAERYLEELQADLTTGRYRPQATRRVEIPKGNGKTRPLGIPTVKDRIVQAAVKRVIEPIFEHEFLPMSYGFRPGRGCKDALRDVDDALKAGMTWVVDADLQGYFDSIPHDRLMTRVEERISDGQLLALLRSWLTQDIVSEMARWSPTAGSPQGAVISPLLANVYLHPLDQEMTQRGYRMVRYADDFVILCHSEREAHQALSHVREWVAANGLTLHPGKDPYWGLPATRSGVRFPGLPLRSGKALGAQEEPQGLQGQGEKQDAADRGQESAAGHRLAESHAERLVWLLPARLLDDVPAAGWLHSPTAAGHAAQAGEAPGARAGVL